MRVLVQRVTYGQVLVDGRSVGEIAHGFVLLVGVTHSDTKNEADWLAEKVAGLRVFEDNEGKMNRSLLEVGGSVLVVSQFTLYGEAKKGKRPSFTAAARPEQAEPLIQHFTERLRQQGLTVATGQFRAMMNVQIHNDGPVTLLLEKEAGS